MKKYIPIIGIAVILIMIAGVWGSGIGNSLLNSTQDTYTPQNDNGTNNTITTTPIKEKTSNVKSDEPTSTDQSGGDGIPETTPSKSTTPNSKVAPGKSENGGTTYTSYIPPSNSESK